MSAHPTRRRAPTLDEARGIDPQTGEIECADCLSLQGSLAESKAALEAKAVELAGAERDLNTWRRRFNELKLDKEAEAREHEAYDTALDLFSLWCRAAGEAEGKDKPKGAKFSAERFRLILPFITNDGTDLCVRAIVGRCFQHFFQRRDNGSTIHYLEFERIFGSKGQGNTARDNFEESANRAPKDWRQRAEALGWEFQKQEEARI